VPFDKCADFRPESTDFPAGRCGILEGRSTDRDFPKELGRAAEAPRLLSAEIWLGTAKTTNASGISNAIQPISRFCLSQSEKVLADFGFGL
jgi:hypothetical protein